MSDRMPNPAHQPTSTLDPTSQLAYNLPPTVNLASKMLEDIPWGWWTLLLLLAALIVAHILVMPPPRPKFASKTAEWACFFRYVGWLDSVPELHIEDPFARYFVRPSIKVMARILPAPLRRKRMEAMSHYALGWVIARTKFYDSIIQERAEQFEQFVILGAGFDCRAYRLSLPSNLKIYEVDRPETQAHKRDCIRFVPGIEERLKRVTFVPVNFNTQKIEDQLPASGYSKDKKTLFLWEAVTQYISAEAVDNVLKFVRENSGSGSMICFDYKYKEAVDGTKSYAGLALKTFVGQENEPYVFGVPEGKINQFLKDRGFEVDRVASPDELSKLVKHSDTEKFLVPGFQDIVIARVP
eukprot:TRINITY_DN48_c0_g1_i1.p1 TRINITY_DN48_c0_g1~~TRINITY_DN48_c0_g1_i1.p1  ORF type:complete len:371 (-),score=60.73 TRINITY_DN48_c0_g1_i1:45-1106(-)